MSSARPADFDSATVMASATARFLGGRGFPILGKPYGAALRPLLVGLNHLPEPARRWLYRVGSGREGLPAEVVAATDGEELAEYVLRRYRSRTYPGALIGSTPGAAVHMAAALGMPLLPQTVLVPLAHEDVGLDDPKAEIEKARPVAEALLAANPELAVHHMSDPANDRLTLARFSYFRIKRRRLGRAYERFLAETIPPGGVLYLVESGHTWPTTEIADRYYFQFGGVGAMEPEEYLNGGERVADFLAAQGAPRRKWDAPTPDAHRPEAEWGFDQALREDVERFAAQRGLRVVRVCFDHADALSPFVAELYRSWYRQLGWPDDDLFVESFVLIDPHWVLRAGAVPYWVTFNAEAGVSHLEKYLTAAPSYRHIGATLVSNGTRTVGLAGPERWDPILARAATSGRLCGVDRRRFPTDLAVFARYRDDLRARQPRRPIPPSMSIRDFETFLKAHGSDWGIATTELARDAVPAQEVIEDPA